jgi:restriction system protein
MKLRMHENSLFAILLRSPWWVSILIAAAITGAASLVIPEVYAFFAALPFYVIGVVAAWKQLRAPSAERVATTLDAVRELSWSDFASALEAAFRREGYSVQRLSGVAADFEVKKTGRVSLVSAKRWKVARTGIEPLRELDAARRAHEAQEGIYVATGEITDNARKFAAEKNIRLLEGADLVKLLPRVASVK